MRRSFHVIKYEKTFFLVWFNQTEKIIIQIGSLFSNCVRQYKKDAPNWICTHHYQHETCLGFHRPVINGRAVDNLADNRWLCDVWRFLQCASCQCASCNALLAARLLHCTSCKNNPRKCKKAGSACAIPAFSQKVSGNTFLNSRPHEVVGARGFEPPTPASRTQYSTRLSYAPILTTHLAVLRPTKRFTALSLLLFRFRLPDHSDHPVGTTSVNFQPPFLLAISIHRESAEF